MLLQDGSVEEWRNVFFLAACLMIVLSIPYLCFGSGEIQPWNDAAPPTSSENARQKHENTQETKT